MRKRIILDANVILRFLLADHKTHSAKALQLFEEAESGDSMKLFISDVCLAEVAWVLSSFYKLDREVIAAHLKGLLLHSGVDAENPTVLIEACEAFGVLKLDFIDCYNAMLAQYGDGELATFDKDYRKFPNLKLMTW